MLNKIVVLDGHTLNPGDNPWSELESLGKVTIFARTTQSEMIDRVSDASIVVTNKVPFDASTIDALPDLKMICVTATGYDVVDTAYARGRGIVVSNVPSYSTESVAQHVFALLLGFLHRVQQHHDSILAGEWTRRRDFSYSLLPLRELSGKTMGIVGLGKIGRATARIADAFGMKVVACSRTKRDSLPAAQFRWLSLEELFSVADIVSLHCPLTDENVKFVDRELLQVMKPHAILINTARGGLIHEADLAAALHAETLGGALLDVVSAEPIKPENPLLSAPRCWLTPHLAWATIEARRRAMQITVANIRGFLSGSPINQVQ